LKNLIAEFCSRRWVQNHLATFFLNKPNCLLHRLQRYLQLKQNVITAGKKVFCLNNFLERQCSRSTFSYDDGVFSAFAYSDEGNSTWPTWVYRNVIGVYSVVL